MGVQGACKLYQMSEMIAKGWTISTCSEVKVK